MKLSIRETNERLLIIMFFVLFFSEKWTSHLKILFLEKRFWFSSFQGHSIIKSALNYLQENQQTFVLKNFCFDFRGHKPVSSLVNNDRRYQDLIRHFDELHSFWLYGIKNASKWGHSVEEGPLTIGKHWKGSTHRAGPSFIVPMSAAYYIFISYFDFGLPAIFPFNMYFNIVYTHRYTLRP